jgi:hypothetical protein
MRFTPPLAVAIVYAMIFLLSLAYRMPASRWRHRAPSEGRSVQARTRRGRGCASIAMTGLPGAARLVMASPQSCCWSSMCLVTTAKAAMASEAA